MQRAAEVVVETLAGIATVAALDSVLHPTDTGLALTPGAMELSFQADLQASVPRMDVMEVRAYRMM